MVRWVVGSIPHGVDPLSYFSFQPVLHDWCNNCASGIIVEFVVVVSFGVYLSIHSFIRLFIFIFDMDFGVVRFSSFLLYTM